MAACFYRKQSSSGKQKTFLRYSPRSYLLTPWCKVLLEKLAKKFPAFHGTPRFITALTSVRHLSLSWANPIQSIYQHPTFWRYILILSTHLRLGLPSGLFPSGFPSKAITLRSFVAPTRSARQLILFRETGVVHRITYIFNYFFFTCFIYSIYC